MGLPFPPSPPASPAPPWPVETTPSPWYQPHPTVPPPSEPPPGWQGGAPGVSDRRRLRIELVVMAIALALPGLVLGLQGITDPQTVTTDVPVIELLATLIAAAGPALIAGYLLWRDGRLGIAGFGRRSPGFVIGYGVLGFVCCFIAIIAVGVVVVLLSGGLDAAEQESGVDDGIAFTLPSLLAAAGISLVAGTAEETVYRAYAITRLEQAGLFRSAIWLPWAVFTAQHLYQGPLALVVVGAVGGVLTWLYRWKRSVWPVMVAHGLYDMAIFLLAAAQPSGA